MVLATFRKIASGLIIICVAISCNMGSPTNTNLKGEDSAKKAVAIPPEIEKLLVHFKENTSFPFIVDSASISKLDKHDSLGTNEVKQLTKAWFKDSLVMNDSYSLQPFYVIDSLKANHTYAKWAQSLGMEEHANAYGLQKIKLDDGTILLEWALVSFQEDADPVYNNTSIYFTVFNNNAIGETFLLGAFYTGADPPSSSQTILAGKLTIDGKLQIEDNTITEDLDSLKGVINHSHYEYAISNGTIVLKNKKWYADREIKIKGN